LGCTYYRSGEIQRGCMVNDNNKKFKLAEGGAEQKTSAFEVGAKTQREATGSSGTEIYGGYFSEEYLNALQGPEAAKVYDKMRRSESQIAMLMNAIMNPIKAANWEFESYKNEPEFEKHRDFVKMCLLEGIDFDTFKHEALTFIPFGFAVFEIVHNVVFNHPEFGTFNGVQALGFRGQKTIQEWVLEKKTGRIKAIKQWAYGDIGENVTIPGEFVLVLTLNKEGDNYEGISALRPMYGAFTRKQTYLKLTAIGVEKYAVGIPIGTIPSGKENSKDAEEFKKVLQAFTSHEKAYITKPQGWEIEIQKGEFDADKIVELLRFENTEMINSVVANFLALGTGGNGGAFALSNDLSDFFTSGIQAYADLICAAINRKIIPDLIKLNFGQQRGYPKLKVTGISDKAGKELAEVVKFFVDSKVIKPDMKLEDFIRGQYKLPKADEATARDINAQPVTQPEVTLSEVDEMEIELGGPGSGGARETVKLDEPKQSIFAAQIDKDRGELRQIMEQSLRGIYGELKKSLVANYKKLDGDNKIKAGTSLEKPDLENYKAKLRDFLSKVAARSYSDASNEVKTTSKKLAEYFDTIKLAAEPKTNLPAPMGSGYYEALPPLIKKRVQAQAEIIAETQEADLEKIVSFQFNSSLTASDDINVIGKDIDESVDKVFAGSTNGGMSLEAAAGNAIAHMANQARTEYFFEPEVLEEIESFTFENNDPVSEICQALAGTTFAVNDPKVDEFTPPLHHNCKSRMVPNLKNASDNPSVASKVEISDKARKSITLSEQRFYRLTH
jgi:hypothetical protein